MLPHPHDLHHFADALMTVPAKNRPALAIELIRRAGQVAERRRLHNERVTGRPDTTQHWGQDLHSVCVGHKWDCERANPGTFYQAVIAHEDPAKARDGIQAFEVALAALLDMVREREAVECAA